jgi:hypothetical protein
MSCETNASQNYKPRTGLHKEDESSRIDKEEGVQSTADIISSLSRVETEKGEVHQTLMQVHRKSNQNEWHLQLVRHQRHTEGAQRRDLSRAGRRTFRRRTTWLFNNECE